MKKEKKEVEKKEVHVVNTLPPEQRAKGVKLPKGNPTLVAKADVNPEKLPANLARVFEKIAKGGREGVRINSAFPKDKNGKCYERWLVRQLLKREVVKAIGEPKAEKPMKHASIANAVKAKKAVKANKEDHKRKAA